MGRGLPELHRLAAPCSAAAPRAGGTCRRLEGRDRASRSCALEPVGARRTKRSKIEVIVDDIELVQRAKTDRKRLVPLPYTAGRLPLTKTPFKDGLVASTQSSLDWLDLDRRWSTSRQVRQGRPGRHPSSSTSPCRRSAGRSPRPTAERPRGQQTVGSAERPDAFVDKLASCGLVDQEA